MNIIHEARQKTRLLIHNLSDETLNKRPSAEEWSIQEVLDHLNKTDQMSSTFLKHRMKEAEIKEVKKQPIEIVEDRSHPRKAPEKLMPDRKSITLEQCKNELDQAREQLTIIISSISEKDLTKVLPHAVFKELTVAQWIGFIGHHEVRHSKQIEEILEKLNSKIN
ncbi:DinB family protein [Bacillus gobiensis]|uniref:DinB family protein n=1 Tax=Bacillus gobiensis TaxID=1441095 RepID=UPI003D215932